MLNSLDILHKGGTILCHDMSPISEEDQVREYIPGKTWNGDVWKAWVKLRKERKGLEMYVINVDNGCGIIRQGNQSFVGDVFDDEIKLTFKNLDKHRIEWLE